MEPRIELEAWPSTQESNQVIASHLSVILDSIVVSIPACHAGDRGSIPRVGEYFSIATTIYAALEEVGQAKYNTKRTFYTTYNVYSIRHLPLSFIYVN